MSLPRSSSAIARITTDKVTVTGPTRRPDGTRAPPYVGRFAPSPTGRLHLGTLTAAVASFLHARQARGEWLVRIEDIDPPREVPGAADAILRTLERLQLHWDRSVLYQSSRLAAYSEACERLLEAGEAFRCGCSRRQIRALTGGSTRYPGTCRGGTRAATETSVRLRVEPGAVQFQDGLCGLVSHDIAATEGDFVIVRRDGYAAYHLAVVVDDAFQGVSHVVRGGDLLDSTPLHLCLQDRLGLPNPNYWHLPVVTDSAGEKLSKRSGARSADSYKPTRAASLVLELLGLSPPPELERAPPGALWEWAIAHWHIEALAGRSTAPVPES